MPRFIQKHKERQHLEVSEERLKQLEGFLSSELEDAFSARKRLEREWIECGKMYAGVPRLQARDVPVPNAPNIEITIGAISADTIYSQAVDLIFNTSPLVTVRPKPKYRGDTETVNRAKALQVFANHIASDETFELREAVDTAILDDIQRGTGILYVPFIEKVKKTKVAKAVSIGPRFISVPPEDVIVPGGAGSNIDELPWIALRFYYTSQEVADYARANSWNLEGVQPLFAKNWVRSAREVLGKEEDSVNRKGTLIDVFFISCYYDIDEDGYDEDLLIVYNHSGRKIMSYMYHPNDNRPINKMVYQKQPHLFYGLGVLQMLKPYEEKLSDIHNYATLNILLANSRVWVGSNALSETTQIWPGKYIPVINPSEDLKSLEMADVYPSIWQDQIMTMQIANQRVGINDVSRGSQIPSRTPGITAMSFLQQVNRRFTPAFDSMRICISNALKQALYRFRERLLVGDVRVQAYIFNLLGFEDGNRVIDTLREEEFETFVDVEITAASASVNREQDRQNAIMLTNVLTQYYQRTIELIMLAANPQTPPEVASVAKKIASAAGEMIDRTIRTFDQVRDPLTFIVDFEQELNQIEQTSNEQQALMQLMQLLGGGQQPANPQLPSSSQGGGNA